MPTPLSSDWTAARAIPSAHPAQQTRASSPPARTHSSSARSPTPATAPVIASSAARSTLKARCFRSHLSPASQHHNAQLSCSAWPLYPSTGPIVRLAALSTSGLSRFQCRSLRSGQWSVRGAVSHPALAATLHSHPLWLSGQVFDRVSGAPLQAA